MFSFTSHKRGRRPNPTNTLTQAKASSYTVGSVDRKGRFPIRNQIGLYLMLSKKSVFFPNVFDRLIRSAYLVENSVFEAHRSQHTAAYNGSDADLTATAVVAAHSESAWHIIFSAREQRVQSPDGSSACYRWPCCQHSCCCARFSDSRQSSTPQPRR